MKKLLFLFALLALTQPAMADPLRIVASFSIIGDMVKTVGGDTITLSTLVGPDADVHTYQPTPEDLKALAAADLIFINGLGFEGWLERLAETPEIKGKIVTVSKDAKIEGSQKNIDPHAWQDLSNGRLYVKNIAAALAEALPKNEKIRARAVAYDAEIAAMDKYVHAQFADIPAAKRKIITSHDAFGYFGAAYGVAFLAPLGMSTESEAAAFDIAKLIEQIKTLGAKKVFIENMANPRLIEQIAKDAGAEIGGTLYSDALSKTDGPAPTYLALFHNNVPKLREAMLSNAP